MSAVMLAFSYFGFAMLVVLTIGMILLAAGMLNIRSGLSRCPHCGKALDESI